MTETVEGLNALSKKLNELDAALAKKALRSGVLQASLPAFKAIKVAAPIGTKAHRTHKGNLVAPGFLKKSVRRASTFRNGYASVAIGVRAEAFYGVAFVDRGTVKQPAQSWFVQTFIKNRRNMEERLKDRLKAAIIKVAKK